MFMRFFKIKYFLFITVLLLLKFNYYEFNTDLNQRFYMNATAMNTFRFRDFEPRFSIKPESNVKPIEFDRLVRNMRKPRGFFFHANDKDFNIDMEFVVPFIQIPINKTMTVTQTTVRSLFNLNFQSILATGAIAGIGAIIVVIIKGFFSYFVNIYNYGKTSRNEFANPPYSILFNQLYPESDSKNTANPNNFVTVMESELLDNSINISHCIQRSLCKYAQQNFFNRNSKSGGLSRIMDGVFSLNIVRGYLNGTAVKDALDAAKIGDNCFEIYKDCNWSLPIQTILKFAKKLKYFNAT